MTTNNQEQQLLAEQRQTIKYIQGKLAHLNKLMFLIAVMKQKQQDRLDLN